MHRRSLVLQSLIKKNFKQLRCLCDAKPTGQDEARERERRETCSGFGKKHKLVPCKEAETVQVCPAEPLAVPEDAYQPKVIIIGAGVAGLSAASRLLAAGFKEFIVLEAKDRSGGRIHTCQMGKALIEMGAEHIDGACIPNPIYQLAAMNNLFPPSSQRYNNRQGVYLTSDGRSLEANEKVFKGMDSALLQAGKLFVSSSDKEVPQSLQKYLEELIEEEVKCFPEWERDDVLRMMMGLVNEKRAEWGEDLSLMSAEQFGSRVQLPCGRLTLCAGMVTLVAALLNQIPKNCILYGKTVQTIRWAVSGCNRVLVKCCDGAVYFGDYAIITVPLGVLKSQVDKMFCPQLPEEKVDAIMRLMVGHVAKIFLEYKAPFWIEGEATMRFAWTPQELAMRQDWVKSIGVIEQLPGTRNMLKVTVGGREAIYVERCSEVEVGLELTRWLREASGDPSLPFPTMVARSKWSTDLFSGGASSLPSVADQCLLACPVPGPSEPCPPVLLFAGEATVPGKQGTLHAAAHSGAREADRILALVQASDAQSGTVPEQQQAIL